MNHLIFHFCLNSEGVWSRYHINKLKRNIKLFNGYKFFSICEPNNNIKNNELLPDVLSMVDKRTTVNYVINDMTNREVKPFFDIHLPAIALMSDEKDYCFYGHTKGASRKYSDAQNAWNSTLWKYNIEKYDELIQPNMGKYKTIGCLRKIQEKVGEKVGDKIIESFHYSGTFFWFACNIFKNAWYDVNRNSSHVIERWPGIISDLTNSLSLFDLGESLNYYEDSFWNKHNIKGDL